MAEQGTKAFLLKMLVVGQNLGQTFTAHGFHGNTIGQAAAFVRAGVIQGQAREKGAAALRNDADIRIFDQTLDR